MSSFQEFLLARLESGGFSTEDVLASYLPLVRQVVETHGNGLCAPLKGLEQLRVDGASIWYESAGRVEPTTHSLKVRKLDRTRGGAIEVIEEQKRKTVVEEYGDSVVNLSIGKLEDKITRPVYLPGYVAWEHQVDHHDPLVDMFSLGMILASLACGLNLNDIGDLESFVANRSNLFALNSRLHPVLAKAIVCMTELSRHRRPQDLSAVLHNLENYREQEIDLDYELAQVEDFAEKDGRGKQEVVLGKLQERLFEISRRNRLLHFKQTMHTLNLTHASVPLSFDIQHIRPNQILTWSDKFKKEIVAGKTVSLSSYLDFREVLYLPSVLDRIRADARRDYAEFGFEQMRLAICFLRWANLKETPPELYDSPLVLLPVKLQKKKGVRDTYFLEPLSDEAEINPVLRHLFKQLYDIELPEKVELTDESLDELHAELVSKIEASEPGVALNKIDRPRIDLIHDQARRRLDRYCRRARLSGQGIRKYLDIDYSYDARNFHPLGLQLFNAMVRPATTHLAAIIQDRPRPRSFISEDVDPPVVKKERQFYSLRGKDDGNPFVWEFDLCSVTLGNFRYRKMTLVRDYTELLKEQRTNPAFEATFSLSPRPTDSHDDVPPVLEDRYHVVPCDPTQTTAVGLAQSGKSYIIQGPPGTGKSQTITNLIADYVMRGKRVLFVCEKRAAIDVVYHRLRQLELHDLCCLIHDSQADKKEFVMDLKKTYEGFLATGAKGKNHKGIRKRLLKTIKQELKPLDEFNRAILQKSEKAGVSVRELLERAIALAGAKPELTPIEQESLPDYRLWAENRQRLKAIGDIIRDIQKDGVLAHYPLRWLNPDVRLVERPLELITNNLNKGREVLGKIIDVFQSLALPLEQWQSLTCVNQLLDYADRLAPLAEHKLCDVLNSDSDIGKTYSRQIARYQLSLESLEKKREVTTNWRDKLPPGETDIALEQARVLQGGLLVFLKPGWWRMRKVLRQRYDFSAHAVKPSWVQILTSLQEEHAEAEKVSETARGIAAELQIPNDLEQFSQMVVEISQFVSKTPEGFQAFHRELVGSGRGDEAVTQLNAMREEYETLTGSLEACLAGYQDHPLEEFQSDLGRILDSLDELPEYMSCLKELVLLPDVLSSALRNLPFTSAQLEAAIADATLKEICRSDISLNRFSAATRNRHVRRLEVFYDKWLEGNARVTHDMVRRKFLECIRITSLPAAELTPEQKEFKKEFNRGRREVEHEFSKSMRYKSVRDLVAGDSGLVVKVLKPVWLMSPLSVSDALPLDTDEFDVVIFDEASQITLEEAIPSIFRADQAIVVGDEMQLPPTNFFSAKQHDEDEEVRIEEAGEIVEYDLAGNSFLNHAAKNLSSKLLGWHYRSRSESLISYSNWAFYQGRLLTVPEEQFAAGEQAEILVDSPGQGRENLDAVLSRPISYHFLQNGIYLKRRNRMEADYIAQLVYELLTKEVGLSIGIVAFSEAQQDEIESALDRLSREDSQFRDRLEAEVEREEEGQFMGLLVKNLENIQGDERDIVIMSICYGYNPDGKMFMNFGPINQSGGEKRLNVAFSRAKHHMVLVSSIQYTDIKNDYNDGANCLKNYLHYAAASSKGDIETAQRVLGELAVWRDDDPAAGVKESAVVTQIAASLREKGHQVDTSVGMSHFRCDLAVRSQHENRYRLGILVDTPAYYDQSDLLERDMMKPKLLQVFGWNITHVLAKEWHLDPEAVLEHLEQQITGIADAPSAEQDNLNEDLTWIYESSDEDEEEEQPIDPTTKPDQSSPAAERETSPAMEESPSQSGNAHTGETRYFELISGKSSKFWEITLSDNQYTVRYGRIGAKGQSKTKSFKNLILADIAVQKAVQQKIAKGYQEKT
jgi:predicted DNA-binding WGR domain protein